MIGTYRSKPNYSRFKRGMNGKTASQREAYTSYRSEFDFREDSLGEMT